MGNWIRQATWSDIMEKAQRLRDNGNVQVQQNMADHITGQVVGEGTDNNGQPDLHSVEIWRNDPNSGSISSWSCDCGWGEHSWGRTRIWKKYEGRPCSHVLALYWQAATTPLQDENQQTIPGLPQTQQPLTPPTPAPNTAPPEDQPSEEQSPLNLPNAIQQTVQQQKGPQTKGPEQQMILNFPGAFSKWHKETSFTNGDYVRLNVKSEGIDDRGNTYQIPRNKIGEVIWSDETETIAIFSLESGPLGPQNARVTAPTAAFSWVPRERGTAPRRRR